MATNHLNRSGLLVAGNWILDQVKLIDKFPAEQSLVNILHEYTSNGGSAYNILMDLTKLQAPFPLEAVGLVGNDFNGIRIVDHCREAGIDVRQLQMIPDTPTSYTIVTSVKNTGKRTFFHHRGANSLLDIDHFDFRISQAKIFHLGYLLLLDRLDEIQKNERTRASLVLEKAKREGFLTSVDLVSEDSDRFTTIIPCALPYVDYLFLNEYEASRLSGIDLMEITDTVEMGNRCKNVFEVIFQMGVNEWVIIHHPDGVWASHRDGRQLFQPSLQLPQEKVVGANGAGDALAAGVLLGLHEGWNMDVCLDLGVCAAAASLSHATCSDGILSQTDCLALSELYGYRKNEDGERSLERR
ncbi:carbohydrate kinase family protein [Parapedobacter indicus]|uniref:Sugar or nucleoside kinase, ribokinase family n=1 Tax=Parapedobacter indicus TaxID=1477437 RepID=A0A1I3FV19_9SPHI|nr:carbohydrate kinase family protein [Parapedobacter indicus]PPL03896.1 sugar/nucleoside kinase (ribokinase family) [Parapedobacter indicus]SFI14902.1 Sugar or nucleoside kinase, ribokinase family [Parapedobacter indicus]